VTTKFRELGSEAMARRRDGTVDGRENLLEMEKRVYRERDEAIARIPEELAKEPVELSPYTQELLDTSDEFYARMRAKLRWLVENAPF
jgi:thiamine biosynthesis lipoprotein ApbE